MSGQRKAIPHPRISLRLPQDLLDSIKSAANARDVPYQSLITAWLQEKVQQVEPAQDPPAGSLQEDDDDLDGPTPHTM